MREAPSYLWQRAPGLVQRVSDKKLLRGCVCVQGVGEQGGELIPVALQGVTIFQNSIIYPEPDVRCRGLAFAKLQVRLEDL